jgi:hypothetical protein
MKLCRRILFLALAVGIALLSGDSSHGQPSTGGDWYLADIHAPGNMKRPSTKNKVVVAVVDDGVRITHQDLEKFIWTNPKEVPDNNIDDDGNGYVDDIHGWDVADNKNAVTPPKDRLKDFYHGTHLAGIIARIGRSAYGEAAPDLIRIMPVKSLSNRADKSYIKYGYKGIEYAVKAGAGIILCAWGVGHVSPEESMILDEARKKGVLVVASAGNFPEEREQFPAAHDSVLAVGGLDQASKKQTNSNYGAFLGLSAPGTNIGSTSVLSDSAYETREGTSPASAMVAAAAGLVKLQHPSYSMEKVKACIKSSVDSLDVTDPQFSAKLGAGKLNIEAAVACSLFNQITPKENQLLNPQGYFHYYNPKGKQTSWTVKPQGVFKGLRFNLLSLQGKPGQGIIKFHAGESPEARLIASHSLASLPQSIFVPGTAAHVTFEAKQSDPKLDWLMEYKADAIKFSTLYCHDTAFLEQEGTFEDGSGPKDYSPKTDCKWLITAPKGQVVHLKFTQFDTEARSDLLYFFNGAGTHEKIMAVFSGPDIPPELTTWSNQVLVWFVTDGKNQGKGWTAEYRFVTP